MRASVWTPSTPVREGDDMSRLFEITVPTERVRLSADGRGQMVFSVTNRGSVLQRVSSSFAPSGTTRGEWLSLSGEPQRDLSGGATDQFIVNAQFPPGTPGGAYPFRLRVASANNRTSEDYDESPLVNFEMPAGAGKKKPWWIAIAAAVLLVVIAVAFLLFKRDDGPRVPDVTKKEAVEAIRAVQSAKLGAQLEFAADNSVANGHVIRSKPAAGESIEEHGVVLLTIARAASGSFTLPAGDVAQLSDGTAQQLTQFLTVEEPPPPKQVEVPGVVGKSAVDAMLALQNSKLTAKLLTFVSFQVAPNVVLQQDLAAGSKVAPGSQVTLVIAQQPSFVAIRVRPEVELNPVMRKALVEFNDNKGKQ